ncbi:hypothetical protein MJO28_006294 [Puccinia striiformis f. sp. tritici]|uniref:Uncharacterized protein n=4 Tax=Puccinia striiformis TaxID=27350 RepID=A0A0L0VKZ6_9BASI|nr:hypothetical protein Pst134EA_011474 [Puccinia striiformis f. sp. tritici]KAI9605064.1 hypothetical protein H4Q26_003035 [Puccinia striiformis f. sp. tritici PST-130]KNE99891.1 hypothetical protein PSTG_06744 [Puccinia striiformis f. sp. tritici PST-78]POV96278.1 hypothetical protein PSTT_15735 [Puccinia striiformis]KAH9456252.1 hypothetical protein Pst134EB_012456 [Puccinia striiformis f. sp. tritici]KAH9467855.1 hypothetical protein Pst134EA_011474 [Puccinia striiformis f. sp. tritici]
MSLPPNLSNHVRSYLTGPEVDLQTVSAKQIRKKLATIFPDLDIKALRSEIDEISIPIFHEIKESLEGNVKPTVQELSLNNQPAPTSHPDQQDIKPTTTTPSSSLPALALPPRGKPGVVKTEVKPIIPKSTPNKPAPVSTNTRSGHTPNNGKSSSTSAKSKKRKSAAYVDTDDEEEGTSSTTSRKDGAPKRTRIPKEGDGPGSNKGIHLELHCSSVLSDVIGVQMSSRPQVVKKIWEYIKSNELQNPKDRRQILCDEPLKKIFNQNSVNMFTMNKLLGDHLWKPDEVVQPPPSLVPALPSTAAMAPMVPMASIATTQS